MARNLCKISKVSLFFEFIRNWAKMWIDFDMVTSASN
jgi:hypothetical protein